MPREDLTQRFAESISQPAIYWDNKLKGFGLIVRRGKHGVGKSWIVQRSGRGRKSIGRFPVMHQQEARLLAREELRNRGLSSPISLETALTDHLMRMERNGNQLGSMRLLDSETRNHLNDWLTRDVSSISRTDCRARHDYLSRNVGEQTADRVMRHLRAIYNTALKTTDLPTNPTIGVFWHGIKRRDYPRLDLATFWAKVDALGDPILRNFSIICLSTGLRRTDCQTMRWSDIDLGTASINRPNPKGGAKRAFTFPISTQTAAVLEGIERDSEFVFPGPTGGGYIGDPTPKLKREGIAENSHHFHAEFAALATDLGVPTYHKKLLINHAVPRADVTDGYVANPEIEMLRPWTQKISDQIFSSRT